MTIRAGGNAAAQAAERDARLARYAELRDAGVRQADIVREMGISYTTGNKYSRWYRETRHLPPQQRASTAFDRDPHFWLGDG